MIDRNPRRRLAPLHLACIAAGLAVAGPAAASDTFGAAAALRGPWASLPGRAGIPRTAAALHTQAPALVAGATIPVTNCGDDGGFDELRHAVLTANAYDTIDLSGANCSQIVLQNGPIVVGVSDLTIAGPTDRKLTIDGNAAGRVFDHEGLGTLELDDLTIANGKETGVKVYGGCIYAKGSVTLTRVTVTSCTAQGSSLAAGGGALTLLNLTVNSSAFTGNVVESPGADKALAAAGGAAFAIGQLSLENSIVSGNSAQSATGKTYTGGVVGSVCRLKYSTITQNTATSAGTGSNYSIGGGLACSSDLVVYRSTIDHNSADLAGGVFIGANGTKTANFLQSTVSGNHGVLAVGAIDANSNMAMSNSTVAFNYAGNLGSIGVLISGTATLTLNSTIIADNSAADLAGGGMIGGAANLVKIVGANATLPADTLSADPQLGPLGFRGGITRTHVPGAGSPAIDAGSNIAVFAIDQRGPTYRRIAGTKPDIGAVEVDTDHIFGSDFGNYFTF